MKNRVSKVILMAGALLLGSSVMARAARHLPARNIPDGILITVRINEDLSSETAKPGDVFTGVLTQPLVVNGATLFPRNATVKGQIVSAKKSGRLSNPGELELGLISINNTSVASRPFLIKGASHTRSNLGKIGGGTAAGAIIGGIVGGCLDTRRSKRGKSEPRAISIGCSFRRQDQLRI